MHLIHAALLPTDAVRIWVEIPVDRRTLAKRRWRAKAEDGTDFGCDLHQPLGHGHCVWIAGLIGYRIDQLPEPVLRIPYATPQAAGRLGWLVGNLHFLAEFAADGMLVEDDLAVRQLLEREGIPFLAETRRFTPPITGTGHHHHHPHEDDEPSPHHHHHHHHHHHPHGHG